MGFQEPSQAKSSLQLSYTQNLEVAARNSISQRENMEPLIH